MASVAKDTIATVHYTGTLPDGEVFDSSRDKDPMTFLVGHKNMIPGFEEELMGASKGETRTFTLPPERAYGERDDDAIQQVSRDQFPENMEIKPGMMMAAQTDQGPIPFTISEINGDQITIDFNHQMAGKTLTFEVEVIDVRDATPQELPDDCGPGCGCN
ncbi:MAG: peptidylprolyl isomerase [Euryarchaeota archaeon]|nr:peptidylprolyl isomerase [Euryarchaeota archaeon]